MADAKQMEFDQRIRRIDRTHRKLSKGYVTAIDADGLIVAKPQVAVSRSPLRGIFLALAVMITFKAYLFGSLGAEGYGERVALLQQGTFIEKIGAYAMAADPVTVWISQQIGFLL